MKWNGEIGKHAKRRVGVAGGLFGGGCSRTRVHDTLKWIDSVTNRALNHCQHPPRPWPTQRRQMSLLNSAISSGFGYSPRFGTAATMVRGPLRWRRLFHFIAAYRIQLNALLLAACTAQLWHCRLSIDRSATPATIDSWTLTLAMFFEQQLGFKTLPMPYRHSSSLTMKPLIFSRFHPLRVSPNSMQIQWDFQNRFERNGDFPETIAVDMIRWKKIIPFRPVVKLVRVEI